MGRRVAARNLPAVAQQQVPMASASAIATPAANVGLMMIGSEASVRGFGIGNFRL